MPRSEMEMPVKECSNSFDLSDDLKGLSPKATALLKSQASWLSACDVVIRKTFLEVQPRRKMERRSYSAGRSPRSSSVSTACSESECPEAQGTAETRVQVEAVARLVKSCCGFMRLGDHEISLTPGKNASLRFFVCGLPIARAGWQQPLLQSAAAVLAPHLSVEVRDTALVAVLPNYKGLVVTIDFIPEHLRA